MSQLAVPITESSHQKLQDLVRRTGLPMEDVLDQAIEGYRRQQFLQGAAEDYARLRADPEAWNEELADRKDWDAVVGDDLQNDPYPADPARPEKS